MFEEAQGNAGCTRERRQHSNIAVANRTVTPGGIVIGLGMEDTEHCLLDRYKAQGWLGNEEDAATRYYIGYKLREVYFDWRKSGKSLCDYTGSGNKAPHETDEETPTDKAEQLFHDVMRALPHKYHRVVRYVCLSEGQNGFYSRDQVCDSLDALYGAFYRVEKQS